MNRCAPLRCPLGYAAGDPPLCVTTGHCMARFDVYARDDGELLGEDVAEPLARLIIGCLNDGALIRFHGEGEPVTPAELLPA